MTTEPPAPPGAPAPPVTPAGRLGQGELRRQVAAHLAAAPGGAFTPVAIARALNRSAGATGNALATLAARGEAERVPGKPARFRATPATAAAATAARPARRRPARTIPRLRPAPPARDRQLDRPGPGVGPGAGSRSRELTRFGLTSPYPAPHATSTSASIIFWANARTIARSRSGGGQHRLPGRLARNRHNVNSGHFASPSSHFASRRIARWPPGVTPTRRTRARQSQRDQSPYTPQPWTLTSAFMSGLPESCLLFPVVSRPRAESVLIPGVS
jgi:hypothetical protein